MQSVSPGNPGVGTDSVLARLPALILPVGLVASLLVILMPMPPALMDLLLSANIATAVIMLLTTVYVRTPLEFSVFPSLLLATTLLRLVLNVATTRLILTRAETAGLDAAGSVVRTFGEFVAGDQVVVGLIIFLIIVVIQFVVITKGATRIGEVAARFMLDGMPGRQMAIDADLAAGVINQQQAQQRRADVTRQADFFGAMDGASKFVRGDAVAGIIIIAINIVGGLFIGIVQSGMDIRSAAEIFTKLTIGDGLVTQVPAFLISLAAGLLVTRSSEESNLPAQFIGQMFSRPEALLITAGFLGLLTFTHLPLLPLLAIGGGSVALALSLRRKERQATAAAVAEKAAEKKVEQRIEQYLAIDPMEIEIGIGLIRLADPKRGGDLLARVQRVRQSVAAEIGIVMPKVRIRDNTRLDQNQYGIKVADNTVGQARLHPSLLLAMAPRGGAEELDGLPGDRGIFDRPATWIQPSQRANAERLGYAVYDATSVVTWHLTKTVRRHAAELLTRDATNHLINELKTVAPAVVDELIPDVLKLAEVQQVLQLLLSEHVPIRNLSLILESLGDFAPRSKEPAILVEHVRQRLARTITNLYRDRDHRLPVVTLDPAVEERIRTAAESADSRGALRWPPASIQALCQSIREELDVAFGDRHPQVLLVSPQVRAAVRQLTAASLPDLVVLSYSEITADTMIESVGVVTDAVAVAA